MLKHSNKLTHRQQIASKLSLNKLVIGSAIFFALFGNPQKLSAQSNNNDPLQYENTMKIPENTNDEFYIDWKPSCDPFKEEKVFNYNEHKIVSEELGLVRFQIYEQIKNLRLEIDKDTLYSPEELIRIKKEYNNQLEQLRKTERYYQKNKKVLDQLFFNLSNTTKDDNNTFLPIINTVFIGHDLEYKKLWIKKWKNKHKELSITNLELNLLKYPNEIELGITSKDSWWDNNWNELIDSDQNRVTVIKIKRFISHMQKWVAKIDEDLEENGKEIRNQKVLVKLVKDPKSKDWKYNLVFIAIK